MPDAFGLPESISMNRYTEPAVNFITLAEGQSFVFKFQFRPLMVGQYQVNVSYNKPDIKEIPFNN
jgi:hypothetical protein